MQPQPLIILFTVTITTTAVFVILKLADEIEWGWFWIMLPVILLFGFNTVFFLVVWIFNLVEELCIRYKDRRRNGKQQR